LSAEQPAARRPFAQWLIWLFAVIGALGIVAVIVLAAIVFDLDRPYLPAKVAGAKHETILTIGQPQRLRGTPLLEMNISASDGGMGSGPYSGGRSDDVRNILIVDSTNGASRRLLPDNAHHIVQSNFYPAKAQPDDESDTGDRTMGAAQESDAPAAYYVIQLRRESDAEREDVLIGTLATGKQGAAMRGIDGVDRCWMLSPTRMGFLVRQQLRLYYRVVNIPSLKVVQSRPIAID
jgi:hypothetical protein